jgi:hypothetical protein
LTALGGTLTGPGATTASGGLEISGEDRKTLNGRQLSNLNGNAVWKDGGEIYAANGAVLENLGTGVLDIRTSAGIFQGPGNPAAFTNDGTVIRSDGSDTLEINVPFTNTAGTLDVRTGTVRLTASVRGGGVFHVAAGAALDFNGDSFELLASAQITGEGTVNFDEPGTVTLPGVYAVTGATNVYNGTVVFGRNATLGGLALRGGEIGITERLTVTDQLIWTEGGITGSGVFVAAGGAALSSDNTKWLIGVTFANAGTATWAGAGTLLFIDGASWDNLATGVLDAQGDSEMFFLSGQPTGFQNAGQFKKSAGQGLTYISTAFRNTGTVQVLSGTLAFGAGGTSTTPINIATGAILDLNDSTYTLQDITGTGTLVVSGATVTLSGGLATSTIQVTDGKLTANGTVSATTLDVVEDDATTATATFNGTVTVGTFTTYSGTVGGRTTVVFEAPVTVQTAFAAGFGSTVDVNALLTTGTLAVSRGALTVRSPLTTDTFTASGATVALNDAVSATISFEVSGGSVTVSNGLTTARLTVSGGFLTLNGSVLAQSVRVGGGLIEVSTVTHLIETSPGATILVGGSLSTSALDVLGATGLVTDPRVRPEDLLAAAGVFEVNGTATVQDFNLQGRLTGTGTLTITGALTWVRGWMDGTGTTNIPAGATLTLASSSVLEPTDKYLVQRILVNAGMVSWVDGNVLGSNGAAFQNLAGATFQENLSGPARRLTIPTVNNAGLIRLRASTFSADVTTNTGTLDVSGTGATFATGTLTNFSEMTLTGGTYLVTGTLRVSGADIRTNAATIVLDGSAARFVDDRDQDALQFLTTNATGGQLTILGRIFWTPASGFSNAGVFILGSASQLNLYGRNWNNTGSFQWQAGASDIYSDGNSIFNNQQSGTFEVQSDRRMYNHGHFLNAGTFRKSAGTGSTTIEAAFDNTGTVEIQTGALILGGGGSSDGSFIVQAEATLDFTHFFFTTDTPHILSATSSVSGAGNVLFGYGITTINSVYTITGSTSIAESFAVANFNTNVTLATLILSDGYLGGSGTVTVSGPLVWTTGIMNGSGQTVANGGLAISGPGVKALADSRTLINMATGSWSGTADIYFYNDTAMFINEANAVFEVQNDQRMSNHGHFLNAGTFRKSTGTGSTTIEVAFDNAGTVEIQTGTLFFSSSFPNFATGTLTSGRYVIRGTLQFNNANIRTNNADIVLDGPPSQIVDQSGNNALANFAVNDAAGSFRRSAGKGLPASRLSRLNGYVVLR